MVAVITLSVFVFIGYLSNGIAYGVVTEGGEVTNFPFEHQKMDRIAYKTIKYTFFVPYLSMILPIFVMLFVFAFSNLYLAFVDVFKKE